MAVVGRPLRRAEAARSTDLASGALQWAHAHAFAAADVGAVKAAAAHGGRLFVSSRRGVCAFDTGDGRCGGGARGSVGRSSAAETSGSSAPLSRSIRLRALNSPSVTCNAEGACGAAGAHDQLQRQQRAAAFSVTPLSQSRPDFVI